MPITIRELLDAGAHFGHQTHRWNPKMKPYIFGARNGIYIINLEKTAAQWKIAEQAITETVSRGRKVLFVGTKPAAQEIVAEEALRAGQFYVNRRWLGGMLTNFRTIKSRIDRLEELDKAKENEGSVRLVKKETLRLEKERQKLERSLYGIKKMSKLPGLVIVIDPNKEHIASREARKLGIPLLAITDTNCNPEGIDLMIPANDDAIKSVKLFVHAAAEACMQGEKLFEKKIQEETRRKAEAEAEAKRKQEEAKAAAPAVAPVVETAPVSSQVVTDPPAEVEPLAAQSEPRR